MYICRASVIEERVETAVSLNSSFFLRIRRSSQSLIFSLSLSRAFLSRASTLFLRSLFLSPSEHGTAMMMPGPTLPAAARMPAAPSSTKGGASSSSPSSSSLMPLSAAAASAKPSSLRRNRSVAARAVEIAPEMLSKVRGTRDFTRCVGLEPLSRGGKCPRDCV